MFVSVLITLFILCLSVALQSMVGFGLGLVSIPLLLMQGYPLQESVFLGLSVSLFSSLVAARQMGDRLPWRQSAVASGYRVIGAVPGLWLAHMTRGMSPELLKGLIGIVVGVGVLAQALKMLRPKSSLPEGTPPSARLAPWAFLSSGVMTGWLGMGGPPLVFWQLTGRPSPSETRGFLFGVYLMTIPFQLAVMVASAPREMSSLFPLLLAVAPLTWATAKVSLRWGDRLSSTALSWASLIFLAVLSLRSVAEWVLA